MEEPVFKFLEAEQNETEMKGGLSNTNTTIDLFSGMLQSRQIIGTPNQAEREKHKSPLSESDGRTRSSITINLGCGIPRLYLETTKTSSPSVRKKTTPNLIDARIASIPKNHRKKEQQYDIEQQQSSPWSSPLTKNEQYRPLAVEERTNDQRINILRPRSRSPSCSFSLDDYRSSGKVRVVIPTTKKVRYTHLESSNRIMPREQIEGPMVYERDGGVKSRGRRSGGERSSALNICKSKKMKKGTTPLWLNKILVDDETTTQ